MQNWFIAKNIKFGYEKRHSDYSDFSVEPGPFEYTKYGGVSLQ